MKPKWLKITTLLLIFFDISQFPLTYDDSSLAPYMTVAIGACVVLTALALLIIRGYWKGRNWARWCILLCCPVSIISISEIGIYHPVQQVLVAGEALFGVFLLYWLNKKYVKAYFKPSVPATV